MVKLIHLNCFVSLIIGKQNHSPTFPFAWTNVDKKHLQNHKGKPHTQETCDEIRFLTMADYEENIVNHTVKSGNQNMAETGKQFGSIVGHNLCPLNDIFKYIPPPMHYGTN